jgi:hypothetical protein
LEERLLFPRRTSEANIFNCVQEVQTQANADYTRRPYGRQAETPRPNPYALGQQPHDLKTLFAPQEDLSWLLVSLLGHGLCMVSECDGMWRE